MTNQQNPPRTGFTLIELLAVIAIIGIVMGLLLSAVQAVRGAATRISCANKLRQIGLACHLHHDQFGHLPPAYALAPELGPDRQLIWPVRILPFIEQDNLWSQAMDSHRRDAIGYHNPPHTGLTTVVNLYICPADSRLIAPITDDRGYTAAYGSYVGIAGSDIVGRDRTNGAMRANNGMRLTEILDGTSNTLHIGEKPPWGRYLDGNWYTDWVPGRDPYAGAGITYLSVTYPDDYDGCVGPIRFGPGRISNPCDNYHFWSLHSGGGHFAFADGSVRFLNYSARDIMPALATRAGGEVVTVP